MNLNLHDILSNIEDNELGPTISEDLILTDYLDPSELVSNTKGKFDNDNHLNILHLNADSLTTKFDAFSMLIKDNFYIEDKPLWDIIAISETHLRAEKGTSNQQSLSAEDIKYSLPKYSFFGKSRERHKKGGVGLFINNSILDFTTIDPELSIFQEVFFNLFFSR